MKNDPKAPALTTGLKLIEIMSESRTPLGVSELARMADSNKNMTSRLLSDLQSQGWIEAIEPGPRYQLTLKPFRIISQISGNMSIAEAARIPLQELWETTGESTYLGVLNNDKVLYLAHLDAVGPVRIAGRVGGEYPLHCSAPGKVILAHSGENLFKKIVKTGLSKSTKNTIGSKQALSKEIDQIRKNGYATDNEEFGRGIICVAAPVFNHTGTIAGSVGITTTTISYSLKELVKKYKDAVLKCTCEISAKLGYIADKAK